ncbi:tRNA (adenine-N1)-methyltransferase [Nonomuraea sp. KC401]|uniref:tRNA (adenine-N1)-methyltransferase n=1 Tax=unclassified Nonomuraea TaxID=2593643 RepID=UPI0010FD2C2B|nr:MULTISPECIES: tRNA (adenine-N1)-methyltransferase [unclassified Nonomuraea]NBF00391.1 tRNA (adenine-N1)-methyltransferase [Nonomuraea sp. K271]TLF83458.1 tRNA (adenine-N1)-methyltransferase [Nonomuraea sp. KC401]
MGFRRHGPFQAGDQVQLTDPKNKRHTITLKEDGVFHTHKGAIPHSDLIGQPEGSVVRSSGGTAYLAFRHLLQDYTLAMPRGAAVIYPKDASMIVGMADVFPGARVIEAGVGSGALTCFLLRAVGPEGHVTSYERREEFADVARKNVEKFYGGPMEGNWRLVTGDLVASIDEVDVDRVILDMLAPWECVDAAAKALTPGGVICCYVATTTQLSKTVESIRDHGCFTEPHAWETLFRDWHVEGLAVRPDHRMIGHTGFLVTARRMADGVTPPPRRRRPKGTTEEL